MEINQIVGGQKFKATFAYFLLFHQLIVKIDFMRITLNIEENKAAFFMELLKNFDDFITIEPVEEEESELTAQQIEEVKRRIEAFEAGKMKAIPSEIVEERLALKYGL